MTSEGSAQLEHPASDRPEVTWTHGFLDVIAHFLPERPESILDVGCGPGIAGALCRLYRNPKRLVGVDVFRPYLVSLRHLNVYDSLIQVDLSRTPALPFRADAFDVGLALEVIEHLPKDAGVHLMESLKAQCTRVIVSTPNEFFEQDTYDDNPFQRHRSAWSLRDFEERGFDVYGVGGVRGLGRFTGYALGRLTAFFPRASTQLLAVYDRRGKVRPFSGRDRFDGHGRSS